LKWGTSKPNAQNQNWTDVPLKREFLSKNAKENSKLLKQARVMMAITHEVILCCETKASDVFF
jgi:hypothetical protein